MLSDNALRVLERRYLARDEHGNLLEDTEGLFRRVANTIAQADKEFSSSANCDETAERFYKRMTALQFLPNSPTLMNAGRPLGQLSACFVLPVEDSLEGIFGTIKDAALIHQSGGGTGFSFSRLRPEGSAVRSSGGVASGPVSFMKVFNAATEAIKQGGTRRGANMGILRVDHPDIRQFITCKADLTQINNFNISVGLTEAFMEAVENDGAYDLIDPKDGSVVKTERAREIFDLIVELAWQNGEPGIVFLDRLNRDNIVPEIGEIEATNPCGEQPLLPYESCNLGSINLGAMLKAHEGGYRIDYDLLGGVVEDAIHFLDNVITVNKYPLEKIKEMSLGTRKIGLGVMGWADMLFRLGIPYNSDEAITLAEDVMGYINTRAKEASRMLAEKRGPFPYLDRSIYKNDPNPPRNGTVTTIAPTGTISIIASCSSGVEPLFALSFVRNVMDNDALPEVHPYFEEVAKKRGFYTPALMRAVAEHGTLANLSEVPEDVRRVFVTAHDVSPEYHIRMQAAFQRSTDNAVSKTVNFAHEATRDEVREVYELAWRLGCKGVTIYRDGSRENQVLNIGSHAPEAKEAPEKREPVQPRPRPAVTMGFTEKVRIGCGNLYVTVNYDEQGICEVFTNLGRAGGCPSQSEATSRLVSTALRAGMDVHTIIEQLRGIRCHSTLRQPGLKVFSCPDAIGRVLEKVVKAREGHAVPLIDAGALKVGREEKKNGCISNCSLCSERELCAQGQKSLCPECGAPVEYEGGCVVCRACGYSKCG